MSFKIGDIVIVKKDTTSSKKIQGMLGKIIEVSQDSVSIEFFEYMNGHSNWDAGKEGYCWDVYIKNILPINKLKLKKLLED